MIGRKSTIFLAHDLESVTVSNFPTNRESSVALKVNELTILVEVLLGVCDKCRGNRWQIQIVTPDGLALLVNQDLARELT